MKTVRETVAIIGAGPAGLVAARYLAAHGFDPVIFEAARRLGGQWNEDNEASGVWPAMQTLTDRLATRFGDLDYPDSVAARPRPADIRDYLEAYADAFALRPRIRFGAKVESLARDPSGSWAISASVTGRPVETHRFARVVVANGRHAEAYEPDLPGLGRFGGEVLHSGAYAGSAPFFGQRVTVIGGGASATEIAADLADAGVQVILSARALHPFPAALSRFETLGGRPGRAEPPPADDDRGTRLDAHVAACRVELRRPVRAVSEGHVTFTDDTRGAADAIVLATGYRPALDFLDPTSRAILAGGRGDGRLALCRQTFHPDLPGLAFLGLVDVSGPAFPVLENQARWIAYGWAGLAPLPLAAQMRATIGVESGPRAATELAVAFARLAGVEPDATAWPVPVRAIIMFGPLSPLSFRLSGPDALPEAAQLLAGEAVQADAAFPAAEAADLLPADAPEGPDAFEPGSASEPEPQAEAA